MTQFNTDITLDIRGHEFKIEIYGDVDRDGCAENIEMFWQNFKTKQQKDVPHRPAYLYRFNKEKYAQLTKEGFVFEIAKKKYPNENNSIDSLKKKLNIMKIPVMSGELFYPTERIIYVRNLCIEP